MNPSIRLVKWYRLYGIKRSCEDFMCFKYCILKRVWLHCYFSISITPFDRKIPLIITSDAELLLCDDVIVFPLLDTYIYAYQIIIASQTAPSTHAQPRDGKSSYWNSILTGLHRGRWASQLVKRQRYKLHRIDVYNITKVLPDFIHQSWFVPLFPHE